MTDRIEVKAALSIGDEGKLTGIAWPFGEPDRVGDVIEKGAFANVELPLPMLAFHNQAETVGVWERIEEKQDGLHIEGRLLLDDVARAREIHALIKEKAVRGLSIGFCVKKAKARAGGGRIISNLQLVEISVVAVPAHPGAQIISAKTLDDRKANEMENDKNNETLNLETKIDGVADNIKTLTGRVDKLEAQGNRPNIGNDIPQKMTAEVKAFGIYLRQGKEVLREEERKTLTLGNAAQAGYLAPQEFGDEIIKLLRELSPIRQYASARNRDCLPTAGFRTSRATFSLMIFCFLANSSIVASMPTVRPTTPLPPVDTPPRPVRALAVFPAIISFIIFVTSAMVRLNTVNLPIKGLTWVSMRLLFIL